MKIQKFEDLNCWQEARVLMKMVYVISQNKRFCKDYRLKDQITGSAISVANNISEGFDSQSDYEFIRFLIISRRSISEIEACLYTAIDQHYINQNEFDNIYAQSEKTRQLIDGLLRYLRLNRRERRK